MPYIITTRDSAEHGPWEGPEHYEAPFTAIVTRRAIATLGEAPIAVLDACKAQEAAELAASTAGRARWDGSTVGPLPDGTVIEIEPVTEDQLRAAVAHRLDGAYERPLSEVIDAYNAAQS